MRAVRSGQVGHVAEEGSGCAARELPEVLDQVRLVEISAVCHWPSSDRCSPGFMCDGLLDSITYRGNRATTVASQTARGAVGCGEEVNPSVRAAPILTAHFGPDSPETADRGTQ